MLMRGQGASDVQVLKVVIGEERISNRRSEAAGQENRFAGQEEIKKTKIHIISQPLALVHGWNFFLP